MLSNFKVWRKFRGGTWYRIERWYYPDTGAAKRREWWSENEMQSWKSNTMLWEYCSPVVLYKETYNDVLF